MNRTRQYQSLPLQDLNSDLLSRRVHFVRDLLTPKGCPDYIAVVVHVNTDVATVMQLDPSNPWFHLATDKELDLEFKFMQSLYDALLQEWDLQGKQEPPLVTLLALMRS